MLTTTDWPRKIRLILNDPGRVWRVAELGLAVVHILDVDTEISKYMYFDLRKAMKSTLMQPGGGGMGNFSSHVINPYIFKLSC